MVQDNESAQDAINRELNDDFFDPSVENSAGDSRFIADEAEPVLKERQLLNDYVKGIYEKAASRGEEVVNIIDPQDDTSFDVNAYSANELEMLVAAHKLEEPDPFFDRSRIDAGKVEAERAKIYEAQARFRGLYGDRYSYWKINLAIDNGELAPASADIPGLGQAEVSLLHSYWDYIGSSRGCLFKASNGNNETRYFSIETDLQDWQPEIVVRAHDDEYDPARPNDFFWGGDHTTELLLWQIPEHYIITRDPEESLKITTYIDAASEVMKANQHKLDGLKQAS